MLDGTRDRLELMESLRLAGHEIGHEQLEVMLQRMCALSLLMG
jgi:hypothetical protein